MPNPLETGMKYETCSLELKSYAGILASIALVLVLVKTISMKFWNFHDLHLKDRSKTLFCDYRNR